MKKYRYCVFFIFTALAFFAYSKASSYINRANKEVCDRLIFNACKGTDQDLHNYNESSFIKYARLHKGIRRFNSPGIYNSLLIIPTNIVYRIVFNDGSEEDLCFNFNSVGAIDVITHVNGDKLL